MKKFIISAAVAAMILGSVTVHADDDYIILLPKIEDISYDLDQEHVSEEYSTDIYTVLLYAPGEEVRFSVKGEDNFTIRDVLEENEIDYAKDAVDGSVVFTMPDEDLNVLFTDTDISQEPEIIPVEEESIPDTTQAETIQTETVPAETSTPENTEETESIETEELIDSTQVNNETVPVKKEELDMKSIRVSKSSVYIRSKASTSSSRLGMLKTGDRVLVTGEEGEWSKVKFVYNEAAYDGYVKSSLLLEPSCLYTTVTDTEVKTEKSDSASVLGKLVSGEEVVVLEQGEDGWSRIKYVMNGYPKDGFIRAEDLAPETDPEIDPVLR